jgi:nicotinamidase-related amidase
MTLKDQPTLLLIDIQQGLDEAGYYGGRRNNPDAEKRAAELLGFWRRHALPVIHIKHNSQQKDSPLVKGKRGNEIKEEVKPLGHEHLVEKQANSAFINTGLQQYLEHHGMKFLVIAGLTTDHCVSATTRMAGDLGYTTYLVSDATATFDKIGPDGHKVSAEILHQAELACLHREFAIVMDTASIFEKLAL